MVTIFSTPKAFDGLFGTIQRNAITSWTVLSPRPQIILFGDSRGTHEIAAELGLEHRPEIATTERGTPLVSDLFAQAEAQSSSELLCYVNSDIILSHHILDAAARARSWSDRFFMVGQRFDVELRHAIDFSDGEWYEKLMKTVRSKGHLESEISIDWFLFPRGQIGDIPKFAIGRLWWDNWLIWNAAERGMPVVDATAYVPVVHQRHDYSHGGGKTAIFTGPEAKDNFQLLGHWSHWHAVGHARWMMSSAGEIVPARGVKYAVARPRRWASHMLRFTRPIRRRLRRERPNTLG